MSNPFFDAGMGRGQMVPRAEPQVQQGQQGAQMMQQQPTPEQVQITQNSIAAVKANPAGFIHQNFGMNIPQGTNDWRQALNHLARSGQFNQAQMRAFNMVQRMTGMR